MTRQNYGTLRPRRSGGAWQWLVIGFVFGFGCAAAVGLLVVITGGGTALEGLLVANRPTQTPFVITNTPAPATPTMPPTEVVIVVTPTPELVQVLAPTASPTPDPALVPIVQPTATPTLGVLAPATLDPLAAGGAAPITSAGGTTGVQIPSLLQGRLTPLQPVPGGTFQMGTSPQEIFAAAEQCTTLYDATCDPNWGADSTPAHNVTVSPFFIEVTEVTYEQYLLFLNSLGPNRHRSGCLGQLCLQTRNELQNSNIIFDTVNYRVNNAILQFPVVNVTWYGAQAYCQAIGRRLPTEAEWERAARGANNTLFPWGNDFDVTRARTSRPREEDPALVGPRAVQSYLPWNGLYDMAGNVAEWTTDWYDLTYYNIQANFTAPDPQGPPGGVQKTVRGGSWDAVPFFSRSVHRQERDPLDPQPWIGFRCVSNTDNTNTAPAAPAAGAGTSGVLPQATLPTTGTGTEEESANTTAPVLPPPPGG